MHRYQDRQRDGDRSHNHTQPVIPILMNHRGAPRPVTRYQYGRRSRDIERRLASPAAGDLRPRGLRDGVGRARVSGQRPVNKPLTIVIFYYVWSCSRVYVRQVLRVVTRLTQLSLMTAVAVGGQEDTTQAHV